MLRIFLTIILLGYLTDSFASNKSTELKLEETFEVFEQDGKQGVVNSNKEIVIPATYDQIGWSDSEFELKKDVVGYRVGNKWGLISIDNSIITKPQYSFISIRESGPFIIVGSAEPGTRRFELTLIDRKGQALTDQRYIRMQVYQDRIIGGVYNGTNLLSYGIVDLRGKIIAPFQYQAIYPAGNLRFIALRGTGKFILLNDEGIRVSDFEADSIGTFNGSYAPYWEGHLQGLIDRSGNILVHPRFKSIESDDQYFKVKEYPDWFGLNANMDTIYHLQYDEVLRLSDSSFRVSAADKYWLVNINGDLMIPEAVDYIGEFTSGYAPFRQAGKWGVLRNDGKVILKARLAAIYEVNEFFHALDFQSKWHVFDIHGIKKNKVPYDSIAPYDQRFFRVKKGKFWGLMSRDGEEWLNCVYDTISQRKNERFAVGFKGLFGIVGMRGNWIIPPDKYPKKLVNETLYISIEGKQQKIYNYQDELIYFTENKLILQDGYFLEYLANDKVWRISFSGVITSKKLSNVAGSDSYTFSEFEEIYPPSEGFYAIKKDGKYGFIDDQNRLRIANRYDSVQSYSEGLAAVKLLGKWGFINKRERLVIQPQFDEVRQFEHGVCIVKFEGKYNLIDQLGELSFSRGFDDLKVSTPNTFRVKLGDKSGLIDRQGNMLVNYIFDDIIEIGTERAIVTKLNKQGVIDFQGNNILPRSFDRVLYDSVRNQYLVKVTSDFKIHTGEE